MPAQDVSALSPPATERWQQALQNAVTQPAELLAMLNLPMSLLPQAEAAAKQFPLKVPRGFVQRMRAKNPQDPLLRQVLPIGDELITSPDYFKDPVGDALAKAEAGIIHKYHERALFISTGACAVHCRYCFRRHFPYSSELAASNRWRDSLLWLHNNPNIHEVILSGGDPLSLSDSRLAPLMAGLSEIESVHTLRIHSRQPVVLPERVTSQLIETLKCAGKKIVLVIHANHANELDDTVAEALQQFKQAGAQLLNQAVLLKGVNDRSEALIELSQRLFECDVLPYYLHTLDPVQGAAHFDVPIATAKQLHLSMSAKLPGYLVPRLVKEIAGEPNKTPLL